MVSQANDSFAALLGTLTGDASSGTGDPQVGTMPIANGQAGPSEGFNPGQAATSQDGEVFDYDSLDPDLRTALDGHFEKTFVQGHKAELQRGFEKQIADIRREMGGQLALSERNVRDLANFREQAVNWLQGYIKQVSTGDHQPDPRDLAQFLVVTQGAVSQAAQTDAAWQQNYYSAAEKDRVAHEREIGNRASVSLPDGTRQQVFDPQDPTIQRTFGEYLSALQAAHISPQDTDKVLAAERRFNQYRAAIDQAEHKGQLQLLARVRSGNADAMNGRAAIQAERGAQNTGRGAGAAGMTFQQYLDVAKTELPPGSSQEDLVARAMHRQRQAERR